MKSAEENRQQVDSIQEQWVNQLFAHFDKAVEAAVAKGRAEARVFSEMKHPKQAKTIENRLKNLGYKCRYYPQSGWPAESEAQFHITW